MSWIDSRPAAAGRGSGISGVLCLGPLVGLAAIAGLTWSFYIVRAALTDSVEVIKHE